MLKWDVLIFIILIQISKTKKPTILVDYRPLYYLRISESTTFPFLEKHSLKVV